MDKNMIEVLKYEVMNPDNKDIISEAFRDKVLELKEGEKLQYPVFHWHGFEIFQLLNVILSKQRMSQYAKADNITGEKVEFKDSAVDKLIKSIQEENNSKIKTYDIKREDLSLKKVHSI